MSRTAAVFLFLLVASCRVVNEDSNVGGSSAVPPGRSPFSEVDSLLQNGFQDQAVRVLRRMDRAEYGDADILWRFVGAYNSRGMTLRCTAVLDSLEEKGFGDLTGWKISVLDLNKEFQMAMNLVPETDPLLVGWLCRNRPEEMPSVLSFPVPTHLGERASRLLLAPLGITAAQLSLAASDASRLPVTVGSRVERELELALSSQGSWWDDALKSFDPSGEREATILLEAQRMKFQNAGDNAFWFGLIGTSAEVTAARVIASRWPELVTWEIIDLLVDSGYSQTASSIADSRGDPSFSAGVQMALLRSSEHYTELDSLCNSISPGASAELRARAALFLARSLRARDRDTDAFRAYYRFAEAFPWHPTAREGAYLAGRYFDGEQNWREAGDAYLASLRSAGTWEGDAQGYWRGGFCLYMNGRGSLGDSLWEAGCEAFPFDLWRDEMLFWRARYAGRQGDEAASRALLRRVAEEHPWEYYGMLAAERLGIPYRVNLSVESPVLRDDPALAMAAELFSLGYGTAAVEMLSSAGMENRGMRAVALGILGENWRAITVMRSLDTEYREDGRGILPDSLLGWYFPSPYSELISAVADTMTLDGSYIEGIMREESYFNRLAGSSAGAAGLIQLMPGTAGDVARWNGLPLLSASELFLPEHSVLYGSLYINSQARRFASSALFLAAYNAGPGNASRWVDMHGFDPSDSELYIEQITYRETRMYVKNVQRSAWIYGRIRQ
jgi:soluble lytic murein transglycosylase-like protein